MTAPLTLIPVCWRALLEFHNGKNNSGNNLSMKILSYTLEYIDTEIEVNRAQSQMTNGTFPCRLPRRSTGDQISQRTLGKARKKITDTRRHLIEWLALDFPLCNAKAKAHNFCSQWRSIGKKNMFVSLTILAHFPLWCWYFVCICIITFWQFYKWK